MLPGPDSWSLLVSDPAMRRLAWQLHQSASECQSKCRAQRSGPMLYPRSYVADCRNYVFQALVPRPWPARRRQLLGIPQIGERRRFAEEIAD